MVFEKLKGRKLMLNDVIYQQPSAATNWKDYITVVYRDMITDKKETLTIEDPEIDLFTVKPEYRTFKKPRHWLPLEQLDHKKVKYRNVTREIAKIAGGAYKEYYDSHDMKHRKNMFKYPYCMGADINIETYYRNIWHAELGNDTTASPTKLFLDIEVDQINYEGKIARRGECEVNAVTIVDDVLATSHTFLFDNGNNPQIKDFVNHQAEFQKQCHEMFDEAHGQLDYKIYMYTDEKAMLTDIFRLINSLNRDFCLIWNMDFDIPYLIHRLKKLGATPEEIICCKNFPTKVCYYHEDTDTFEWANKTNFFAAASNTHYDDQCRNYAALRKSQGTIKKVNLDAVATKEKIGMGKVDYHGKATIRTLPYIDYVLFVLYNIGDVLAQRGIENKTKDVENLYLITQVNDVGYTDALKQTVTFRGLMYGYLKKTGKVLGHNVNFDVDAPPKKKKDTENEDGTENEEEDTFSGALNSSPELNEANGLRIFDHASKYLYGLIIDFDFSSMYPNMIVSFNIFATTMIGKLIIPDYTPAKTYDEDMGKEYIEDIISGDPIFIGEKWHHLSPIETIAERLRLKYQV